MHDFDFRSGILSTGRVIVGVIVGAAQQLPAPGFSISLGDSHYRRVIVGVIVGAFEGASASHF